MIAIDTNVLVYAHRRESPWFDRARKVVADLAASGAPWAIPWHCVHEFFSTVTKKSYVPPSTIAEANAQIEAWLESPSLALLSEDAATWPILRDLVTAGRIVGPRIYDARIAALCLRHGVSELWSCDRDFSRFPSLRVRNPLIDLPGRAGEPRATYRPRLRRAIKSRT